MKKDGMINGFKSVLINAYDWNYEDIRFMKIIIAIVILSGFIYNITGIEIIQAVYMFSSLIGSLYFMFSPIYFYYRLFKSDRYKYLYIIPVKKDYILMSSLFIWIIGFLIYIVVKNLLFFSDPTIVKVIAENDLIYFSLGVINYIIFFLVIYLIVIGLDIITVVKNIPKLISYIWIIVLIGLRVFIERILPENFLVYSTKATYDIYFVILKMLSVGDTNLVRYDSNNMLVGSLPIHYTDISVSLGGNIIFLIISTLIFIYALSIFEEYNGESTERFINKYIFRD